MANYLKRDVPTFCRTQLVQFEFLRIGATNRCKLNALFVIYIDKSPALCREVLYLNEQSKEISRQTCKTQDTATYLSRLTNEQGDHTTSRTRQQNSVVKMRSFYCEITCMSKASERQNFHATCFSRLDSSRLAIHSLYT